MHDEGNEPLGNTDAIKKHIARILLDSDIGDLRAIVAEVVKQSMTTYDIKDMLAKAMAPIVSDAVKAYAANDEFVTELQKRVKALASVAISNAKLEFNSRW